MRINEMQHPYTPLALSKAAENALQQNILDSQGSVPQKPHHEYAVAAADKYILQLFAQARRTHTGHKHASVLTT